MKRPLAHIIEEDSRKQFALLVPNGWVTNDFTKDYGKDIHLEIFRNNVSTGQMFICQLKGSAQTIQNNTIKVSIAVDTLRYFKTLPQPVLLVFYSTLEKKFWARWANNISYIYTFKEKQKGVSLTMTEEHLIDSSFFLMLESRFETNIARKLNITFSGDAINHGAYVNKFRKWLDKYFAAHFEYNNYHLPLELLINVSDKNAQTIVTIKASGETYNLAPISNDEELRIIYQPVLYEAMLSPLEAEFMFLCSSFFSSYDLELCLLVLSFALPQYDGRYKTEYALLEIGRSAVQNSRVDALQRLIGVVITDGTLRDFNLLNVALFVHDRPSTLINHYRNNLLLAIAKFPKDKTTASLQYNLANYYRIYREFYLASKHFQLARKLDPSYLQRFYWWHEYAGVLYLSGHYVFAAHYYQQSINLDAEKRNLPLTYALLADCMFKICQFRVADKLLQRYVNEVLVLDKLPSPYYTLLQGLCASFTKFGYDGITRQEELSKTFVEKGSLTENMDELAQAVNYDPFNAQAWYNISVLSSREQNMDQAFHAALAAALIFYDERQAWFRCLSLKQSIGDEAMQMVIFTNLVKLFGDTIINDLVGIAVRDLKLEAEDRNEIMTGYEQLLSAARHMLKEEYAPPQEVVRFT